MQDTTFFHFFFQLILKVSAGGTSIASHSWRPLTVGKNICILQGA